MQVLKELGADHLPLVRLEASFAGPDPLDIC